MMILETEDLMRVAQQDEGLAAAVSLEELPLLAGLRTRSIEARDRLATLNPMLDIIYFPSLKRARIQKRPARYFFVYLQNIHGVVTKNSIKRTVLCLLCIHRTS